ncbi:2-amino-4-hydroxy-6-hydroxymethyldihydropteridine diphosphokinase [Aquibium sp. LZ166]|uniref:2-amino-4-hydroxy-6-hydroxymethyldihydropteridine pyrophosphokinase n=1 Tax=Aquibium pacificus TaxID=3153579 RepID=A0ABV3STB7_9HYPH
MPGPNEQQAFLSLGGNLGEPRRAMAAALRIIDADPQTRVSAVSSVYRTPPWGDINQPDFLNSAAEVRTTLSARGLLNLCLGAENALKRIRTEVGGPRSIDVDVLYFGGRSYKEPGLEIPHPRMVLRAFVLLPLTEIAPELELEGKSVAEHLAGVDQEGISIVEHGGNWWRQEVKAEQ